jgi:hypothetical protein
MISVRVVETGRVLGNISREDARVLRRGLEASSGRSEYYIDHSTLNLLNEQGLTDTAIALLQKGIERRDGLTISLEGTERELAEVTAHHEGDEAFVAEQPLSCVVCRHARFRHRRAQLHSAAASFFNVEWLGPTADCYICVKCGYVHWFIPPG